MTAQGFGRERVLQVLHEACARTGISPAGATELAFGENAVFALDRAPVVVRIGRDPSLLDRARREIAVAHWLAGQGVPAVRTAADAPEALDVSGHPVTFWERLPAPVRPAGATDLALLLRRVHALPEPPFGLPPRDLLAGVERWLRAAEGHIDPADADFLLRRRSRFAALTAALTPRLAPGPIHGDALPRNVHVGPAGPILVDLETFSTDLREHDLVVMALSRDRYGLPGREYADFTRTYGWDVMEWEGGAALRGARETASAAWVAQHVPGNPRALAEFRRRVRSLRDEDPTVRWRAF
ncbi:aminoglycoside phosphotransferase family protein [Marinactinospora thermotolerans]|uniref:Putative homoserine kinase type II (Protein kinase fold) n=1 Tax=Marinactinospora thermotolerans DSM 45154 TaxID=1122192 RepID=A0A1T4R3M3_9ACTN|nr:aminoglycoside phosphotransferase family protein [Marinactinospora thermotolerans]SKA10447.1 Putative homoserine kinase type II (protein kinase fold) [Marinactinospora thermotolerans DSM 45154]